MVHSKIGMHVCVCVGQVVPSRYVEELRTMMALLQLFCNGRVSWLDCCVVTNNYLFMYA